MKCVWWKRQAPPLHLASRLVSYQQKETACRGLGKPLSQPGGNAKSWQGEPSWEEVFINKVDLSMPRRTGWGWVRRRTRKLQFCGFSQLRSARAQVASPGERERSQKFRVNLSRYSEPSCERPSSDRSRFWDPCALPGFKGIRRTYWHITRILFLKINTYFYLYILKV